MTARKSTTNPPTHRPTDRPNNQPKRNLKRTDAFFGGKKSTHKRAQTYTHKHITTFDRRFQYTKILLEISSLNPFCVRYFVFPLLFFPFSSFCCPM